MTSQQPCPSTDEDSESASSSETDFDDVDTHYAAEKIQDGTLPDFQKKFELRAIIERVNTGNGKAAKVVSTTDLGISGGFMTEMANHCINSAQMKGKVPPSVQHTTIQAFLTAYPQIARNHPLFRHKSPNKVHKLCVAKLSRKLTRVRSRSRGPACGVESKNQMRMARNCRPGERVDRLGVAEYNFTPQEEQMRKELVTLFNDPSADMEHTDRLWRKTLDYRRACAVAGKWIQDPTNPEWLVRSKIPDLLKLWPHLRVLRFMAFDFDHVTMSGGTPKCLLENYARFMPLAMLYLSSKRSGVLKHRSNSKTNELKAANFEMPLAKLMQLVGKLWSAKKSSEILGANSDEGRLARMIPIYALFERFGFLPVSRAPVETLKNQMGLVIHETLTGRKVFEHNIATYRLFADGIELFLADNEFPAAVFGSVIASYALNMTLPGQLLKQEEDKHIAPRAYQAVLKAVFQNSDGSGSFPLELEDHVVLHGQVRSLIAAIRDSEATVGVKVLPENCRERTSREKHTPTITPKSHSSKKSKRSVSSVSTPSVGSPVISSTPLPGQEQAGSSNVNEVSDDEGDGTDYHISPLVRPAKVQREESTADSSHDTLLLDAADQQCSQVPDDGTDPLETDIPAHFINARFSGLNLVSCIGMGGTQAESPRTQENRSSTPSMSDCATASNAVSAVADTMRRKSTPAAGHGFLARSSRNAASTVFGESSGSECSPLSMEVRRAFDKQRGSAVRDQRGSSLSDVSFNDVTSDATVTPITRVSGAEVSVRQKEGNTRYDANESLYSDPEQGEPPAVTSTQPVLSLPTPQYAVADMLDTNPLLRQQMELFEEEARKQRQAFLDRLTAMAEANFVATSAGLKNNGKRTLGTEASGTQAAPQTQPALEGTTTENAPCSDVSVGTQQLASLEEASASPISPGPKRLQPSARRVESAVADENTLPVLEPAVEDEAIPVIAPKKKGGKKATKRTKGKRGGNKGTATVNIGGGGSNGLQATAGNPTTPSKAAVEQAEKTPTGSPACKTLRALGTDN